MIKLELADYWDLYGLRDKEWKSTDFANEFADCKFEGYSVINVDAGGVGYDIIGEDKVTYSVPTSYENVALRPSMKYSYVKEFCEDVKDLGNGYFEEITSQRPIYETYYVTETYQEPIYRREPVYQTRYYYEIDKWIVIRHVTTNGTDKKPYWGNTALKADQREGDRSETFKILILMQS
jgi:hypothetical protein